MKHGSAFHLLERCTRFAAVYLFLKRGKKKYTPRINEPFTIMPPAT